MLVLNAADVRRALPMAVAVRAVREVIMAHARGETVQPLRTVVEPEGLPGLTLLKPAAVLGAARSYGLKVVSLFPGNTARGLPMLTGFVALLDPDTGVPTAIMDAAVVTEIRTGAASAVATEVLARPDAGDLALLGAGVQARAHLAGLAEVRRLRRVRVWNRTPARAAQFASWAADEGWSVEVCEDARTAVDGADLVCTVTSATEPVLLGEWLAPGCHVNAAGAFRPDARELDGDVLARADLVVVDSVEAAAAEGGDLLMARAEGVSMPERWPELGDVLLGRAAGRTDDADITVFESLGLAIQDLAAAVEAVTAARRLGLGMQVEWGEA